MPMTPWSLGMRELNRGGGEDEKRGGRKEGWGRVRVWRNRRRHGAGCTIGGKAKVRQGSAATPEGLALLASDATQGKGVDGVPLEVALEAAEQPVVYRCHEGFVPGVAAHHGRRAVLRGVGLRLRFLDLRLKHFVRVQSERCEVCRRLSEDGGPRKPPEFLNLLPLSPPRQGYGGINRRHGRKAGENEKL